MCKECTNISNHWTRMSEARTSCIVAGNFWRTQAKEWHEKVTWQNQQKLNNNATTFLSQWYLATLESLKAWILTLAPVPLRRNGSLSLPDPRLYIEHRAFLVFLSRESPQHVTFACKSSVDSIIPFGYRITHPSANSISCCCIYDQEHFVLENHLQSPNARIQVNWLCISHCTLWIIFLDWE